MKRLALLAVSTAFVSNFIMSVNINAETNTPETISIDMDKKAAEYVGA